MKRPSSSEARGQEESPSPGVQLAALLAGVEAATGADEALDRDLAAALGWEHRSGAPWSRVVPWERPAFTGSVDAALALVERVRPEWRPMIQDRLIEPRWWVELRWWEKRAKARGHTAPLAVLAALLRCVLADASPGNCITNPSEEV